MALTKAKVGKNSCQFVNILFKFVLKNSNTKGRELNE